MPAISTRLLRWLYILVRGSKGGGLGVAIRSSLPGAGYRLSWTTDHAVSSQHLIHVRCWDCSGIRHIWMAVPTGRPLPTDRREGFSSKDLGHLDLHTLYYATDVGGVCS